MKTFIYGVWAFVVAATFSGRGIGAPASSTWPADAPQYQIHTVGQGHLDAVWYWPWHEAVSEIHSTFRSILDRMNETPDFTFTAANVVFYEWIGENDPAMLGEIRKRVEEGRWGLAGGWWVEADTNGPSGESLMRQGLYGQLALRRLFGRMTMVANNPDAAGHPATLPQILKAQGMDMFVFTRPRPNEKKLPDGLFWWEGTDGSRVLAYRPPLGYGVGPEVALEVRRMITQMEPTANTLMVFVGAGDHGGGPTKLHIKAVEALRRESGAPAVKWSTPERYHAAVEKLKGLNIPVVRDELLPPAVGGYINVAEFKKSIRACETELATAEKLAAIGSAVWGARYPKTELTSAWKKVLFQQVHDSMNGVSGPAHYATMARDAHGYALDVARQTLYMAAQRLAWQVPAEDAGSQYLFVFNPHPWDTTVHAEYELSWNPATPARVEDETGKALAFQWLPPRVHSSSRNPLLARVAVPAFGYRQIRIRKDPAAKPAEPTVRAEGHVLENEHLRVTFPPSGAVEIFDKDAGKAVLQGPGMRAVVLDDPHDTWANIEAFDQDLGAFGDAKCTVIENGALRGVVRVRTAYGNSTLTMDWILYAGSRSIEADVALDWHEQRKMLKFSLPVAVEEPRATYEVPYGHIVREPNGNEEPGLRWIDVTGKRDSGEYGLAVINNAKQGYSTKGNDMRISVVRSPLYGWRSTHKVRPDVEYEWQNQGLQTFRMLLVPHEGGWQDAGIVRRAEEFVTPVPVVYQGIHLGTRPQSDSFLAVDAPNIVVSVIKQAEETGKADSSEDLILRCYETCGRPAKATLDFRFIGKQWSGKFRPSEIKTLRLNAQTGAVREVSALEQ
ncbi:MAG: alpha-mannosidase [Candidatus Sumerlaeia bacterium]|nr:alpha-mannosidase [Candidatus Sumerlaeia bacterium]